MEVTKQIKDFQIGYLTSIARWAKIEGEDTSRSVHLPHIVGLLQAVGYNIRRIDTELPEAFAPLRNGKKGTRVIITCGYSGQRCYLELPEKRQQCKCLRTSNNSQNYWEVTGKNNSLVETGSDLIPRLTPETNHLIKSVLVLLTQVIESRNLSTAPLSRWSAFPSITFSPPTATESTSDKSLDASRLSPTGKNAQSTPKKSRIEKAKSVSSPDLSVKKTATSPTVAKLMPKKLPLKTSPTPVQNLQTPKLTAPRSVSSPDLSVKNTATSPIIVKTPAASSPTVTTPVQNHQTPKLLVPKTTCNCNFPIERSKSVSTPNLSTKEKAKSPIIPQTSVTTKRKIVAKQSNARLPIKTIPAPVQNRQTPKPRRTEPLVSETVLQMRKINHTVFAHVKSTIPKPDPIRKAIKKC